MNEFEMIFRSILLSKKKEGLQTSPVIGSNGSIYYSSCPVTMEVSIWTDAEMEALKTKLKAIILPN